MPHEDINVVLARIESQTSYTRNRLEEMHADIYSKGGLREMVYDHQSFIRPRRWLEKVVLVAMVTACVPGVIAALVYIVKQAH